MTAPQFSEAGGQIGHTFLGAASQFGRIRTNAVYVFTVPGTGTVDLQAFILNGHY